MICLRLNVPIRRFARLVTIYTIKKEQEKHPWKSVTYSKTKINNPLWMLSRFSNCTDGTKLRKALHINFNIL